MREKYSAREYILRLLYKVDVESKYSNIIRDELFKEGLLNESDKSFVNQIFFGVISRKLTLDTIIASKSKVKPNKISSWISNILRMGLYQIIYLNKIPVSAACSESVKLAKKYGHSASASFVNAILRNTVREIENLKNQNADYQQLILRLLDTSKYSKIRIMSVMHSHPEWMVEEWHRQFGEKFTEELCKANNQVPLTSVRTNITRTSREDVIELLKQKGFDCEMSNYSKQGIILKKGNPINELYNAGLYTVQDEAAMLVSEIMAPQPGEIIADVCSAPGGKTTHIAELMENRGKIYAFDIHPHRIGLVKETAIRLGINIIESLIHDAIEVKEDLVYNCDRVLADVPCSGLGVIRRKPEIKWSRTKTEIEEITRIQKRILMASSKYVKIGGRLIYSTCTINVEENQKILKDFLKENNNFSIDFEALNKYYIHNKSEERDFITLYPNVHNTDGFFITALKRIKD